MVKTKRKEEEPKVKQPSKKTKNFSASVNKANSVFIRIRKIGNSQGILLSNKLMNQSGIKDGTEVIVAAEKGRIIIEPVENKRKINTDLTSWEAQFKAAIKNGDESETDIFEGMENKFDKEEW